MKGRVGFRTFQCIHSGSQSVNICRIRVNFSSLSLNLSAHSTKISYSSKMIFCPFFGINCLLISFRVIHCYRTLSPGEVRAQKSCCHQHGRCQFLQSSPCGLALGVAFGDFRCHHIGVLCFTPDDFIDLIHIDTLL